MRSPMRPLVMLLLVLIIVMVRAWQLHGPDLKGQASIVDGDTLRIHGNRIRLAGIDAPEHDQLCLDAGGSIYQCGALAANRLNDWVDRRPVNCTPLAHDQYDRTDARCSVAGLDIGEWLVSNGLALRYPQYDRPGRYIEAEARAKASHAGLWRGRFLEPRQFRSCMREGLRPAECSMPRS